MSCYAFTIGFDLQEHHFNYSDINEHDNPHLGSIDLNMTKVAAYEIGSEDETAVTIDHRYTGGPDFHGTIN